MNYTIKNKDELERLIQFYEDNKVYVAQGTVKGETPREVLTNLYEHSGFGNLVITNEETFEDYSFVWKCEVDKKEDTGTFDELLSAIEKSWE